MRSWIKFYSFIDTDEDGTEHVRYVGNKPRSGDSTLLYLKLDKNRLIGALNLQNFALDQISHDFNLDLDLSVRETAISGMFTRTHPQGN